MVNAGPGDTRNCARRRLGWIRTPVECQKPTLTTGRCAVVPGRTKRRRPNLAHSRRIETSGRMDDPHNETCAREVRRDNAFYDIQSVLFNNQQTSSFLQPSHSMPIHAAESADCAQWRTHECRSQLSSDLRRLSTKVQMYYK